jgi:hypothetical protein
LRIFLKPKIRRCSNPSKKQKEKKKKPLDPNPMVLLKPKNLPTMV